VAFICGKVLEIKNMKAPCCAFVRVVQSNNGWTQPCGLDFGHGAHFASTSGFGFEEWMNSPNNIFVTDKYRFVHIEAFRQGFNPDKHGYCRLILWCFDPANRQKFVVGYIDNYELATVQERVYLSQTILQPNNFQYFQQQLQQISPPIDGPHTMRVFQQQLNQNAVGDECIFNIKIAGSGLNLLPKPILIPSDFRYNRFGAYRNYPKSICKFLKQNNLCENCYL